MTDSETDTRTGPPTQGDERATLVGFLRWQRDTLAMKCQGLDPGQLATRAVEPSNLSLLGLVRHMADVERGWFRRIMAGEEAPRHYGSADDPDADFDGVEGTEEAVAEAWERWQGEVVFAETYVSTAPSLEVLGAVPHRRRGPVSLRWVMVHMIEEYARHNGHADFLRERIDGVVGQ